MKKSGFTLIELLVVIAIIAILAAILFPVFTAAKVRAQTASCSSNLRQLATAVSNYVSDNNGTYPKANMHYPDDFWFQAISKYVKSKNIYLCPTTMSNLTQQKYHVTLTGGYNNCYGWNIGPKSWTYKGVTYSYTAGMGYYDDNSQTTTPVTKRGDKQTYLKEADVPKLTKTILLGDVSGYPKGSVYDNFMYLEYDANDITMTPSLHNGGGNYAFCDGHVKWISQKDAFDHPELFTRFDDEGNNDH